MANDKLQLVQTSRNTLQKCSCGSGQKIYLLYHSHLSHVVAKSGTKFTKLKLRQKSSAKMKYLLSFKKIIFWFHKTFLELA